MLGPLDPPSFKAPKEDAADWQDFSGGLNTLLRDTELRDTELARMDNMMLIGRGVPTKRWGTGDYFISAPSTEHCGRGLFKARESSDDDSELLAITDWGYLVKKHGASYQMVTGASWPSGYNVEFSQLDNYVYLASENRALVRYDFTDLHSFATLATPTGVGVSNISGATGTTTWSWRITAKSEIGETIGSTAVSMASLPQELNETMINVSWGAVSDPEDVLTGYNIYRGYPGDETWLATVGPETTDYIDTGDFASSMKFPPLNDTTGGPQCKYILRHGDRLILAGFENEPTKILVSGRAPYHERFDFAVAGGGVWVDPDTGDDITGIAVHGERIIVFKENSIWELKLGYLTVGGYTLLDPTYNLITNSHGCSSQRSICSVENDIFFANKNGIYVIGHEPQYVADVLRTNELSVKIRPFFEKITKSDFETCAAIYYDYKYIISYPKAEMIMVYDRERTCWVGPWTINFGINKLIKWEDEYGADKLVGIDAFDNYVSEFSPTLNSDKGNPFKTLLKTKKEDFGDWTVFKTISEVYMYLSNVIGSVDINLFLEERSGQKSTAKSFAIESSKGVSGFGTDQFGTAPHGLSENDAQLSSEDSMRAALIYKTARTIQYEISTFAARDSYELLGLRSYATPQGRGSFPSDWRA
jgi:hypothetical protein